MLGSRSLQATSMLAGMRTMSSPCLDRLSWGRIALQSYLSSPGCTCVNTTQVRNAFLPQYLGQYSGPWHLAQAITGSQYVTTDIDAADTVYVYDYCYYTWWLAFVHSNGRVQRNDATPGDHLLKGYQVRSASHAPSQCPVVLHHEVY